MWRDAARMLPAFALTGCGPEGFSKAFLAYKSRQLAVFAPTINNESSHNSYLDAFISFGVLGGIAYLAIIVWAFLLLFKSRRVTSNSQMRLIFSGLISSLVAVCVHNFFIYDQIPTGLYFFALLAIALIASNISKPLPKDAVDRRTVKSPPSRAVQWLGLSMAVASTAVLVLAVWFSISLVTGDAAIKRAFYSATSDDFDGLQRHGERAIHSVDPTGAYSFLFSRALAVYAGAHPILEKTNEPVNSGTTPQAVRTSWAIETGKALAMKSLPHSLTPESSYVLLAYFALLEANTQELGEFARKAVQWDPNYFNARWLMAEALLAEGDKAGAEREAKTALELRPSNSEAISVLVRARGEQELLSPRIQGLVERARLLKQSGNTSKSEELLRRAIQFSERDCPACHRELALLYEQTREVERAIAEWQEFAREAPERAAAEQVSKRIDSLQQK